MKVQPNFVPAPEANTASAAQDVNAARRKPAAPTAGGAAPSASVEISALSATLQGQGAADVDMDRVNAIRDAIRAGELQINPERIADGLLETARELLGR